MRNRGQIVPKEGGYLVRVYAGRDLQGKRKYASQMVKGTFKQAEQERTRMLRAQDTGTAVEPSALTLAAYLAQWLTTKRGLSPKTLRDYSHLLDRHVIPALGLRKLGQITSLMVSSLYGSLLSDQQLSSRTVRYTHAVLSQALSNAVAWNMIARNPCDNVELPRKKAGGSGDTLSFEETAQFLAHNQTSNDRLHALWRLLLTAGLRPSEALAIRWTDLSPSPGSSETALTISRALKEVAPGKWEPQNETKTGIARTVTLSPESLTALQRHRTQQAETMLMGASYSRSDLIFATRTGHHFTPPNIRKWWKKALSAAGVRQVRLYDTRHTNISQELALGVAPNEVADRHGHDVVTMMHTYRHAIPGVKQAAPEQIERRLAQVLGD